MSLIADALKAAQWERSGADASSRRHRAASDLVGRPLPGPTYASRIPLPRTALPASTRVALGLLTAALVAAGALILHGRDARRAASELLPPTGARSPALRSQRELAQALLGAGDAHAAEPEVGPVRPSTRLAPDEEVHTAEEATGGDGGTVYADFVEEAVVTAPAPVRAPSPPATAATPAAEAGGSAPAPPPGDAFRVTLAPAAQPEGTGFRDAVEAQARGDHAAAVELYLRVLERHPGQARAYNNLGTSYQTLGRLELARQAYRRALDLDPGYAAGWSNLAGVLAALGEAEAARSALAESIRLDPASNAAKVNLANQYAASGGHAEARRLLEEVLRAEPGMPEAHYALARALEAGGEPAAIDAYRRFLETAGDRFPRLVGPVRDRIAQLEKTLR